MGRLQCRNCQNELVQTQRCWLDRETGAWRASHLRRDTLVSIVVAGALLGIGMLSANEWVSRIAFATALIPAISVPYWAMRFQRADKAIDCRCSVCGYQWRQSPE
jgi:hypothetical protein